MQQAVYCIALIVSHTQLAENTVSVVVSTLQNSPSTGRSATNVWPAQNESILLHRVQQAVYGSRSADATFMDMVYSVSVDQVGLLLHLVIVS